MAAEPSQHKAPIPDRRRYPQPVFAGGKPSDGDTPDQSTKKSGMKCLVPGLTE